MADKMKEEDLPMSYSTVGGPWITIGPKKPYKIEDSVTTYLVRLESRNRVH